MRYSFTQRKHEYKRKHLSKYDVEASTDCLHAASKEFGEGKQNEQVLNKIQDIEKKEEEEKNKDEDVKIKRSTKGRKRNKLQKILRGRNQGEKKEISRQVRQTQNLKNILRNQNWRII